MNKLNTHKTLTLASAIGAGILLTACGGGGSSGGAAPQTQTPNPDNNAPVVQNVAPVQVKRAQGSLDPVQDQVSEKIFGALINTAADTPLEGILNCANQTLTFSLLDVADTMLTQLQGVAQSSGGMPMQPDPQMLQDNLIALTANISGLLESLAGKSVDCSDAVFSLQSLSAGNNPLEGTPLAPLGAALAPVLAQVADALIAANQSGDDLQLTTVSSLVEQINHAVQLGLSQIPEQAYEAPVIGGVLGTIATALNDASQLINAVGVYDAEGATASVQTLLDNTLNNVLVNVLPVRILEDQAGVGSVLSGPITQTVSQVSSQLTGIIGMVATPVLSQLQNGALSQILDPIENALLPAILNPLADGLVGFTNADSATLSNPLAPITTVLNNVVNGLIGGILGGMGGGLTGATEEGTPSAVGGGILAGGLTGIINGLLGRRSEG